MTYWRWPPVPRSGRSLEDAAPSKRPWSPRCRARRVRDSTSSCAPRWSALSPGLCLRSAPSRRCSPPPYRRAPSSSTWMTCVSPSNTNPAASRRRSSRDSRRNCRECSRSRCSACAVHPVHRSAPASGTPASPLPPRDTARYPSALPGYTRWSTSPTCPSAIARCQKSAASPDSWVNPSGRCDRSQHLWKQRRITLEPRGELGRTVGRRIAERRSEKGVDFSRQSMASDRNDPSIFPASTLSWLERCIDHDATPSLAKLLIRGMNLDRNNLFTMFNDTWKVIPSFVTSYTLFRGKSAGLQLADEMSSDLRTRWRIILYRGNRCDVWHWNNHGAGGSVANTRLNLFERSPTTRKQSSGDADEGLVSADAGTARLSACVAAITRRLEMSISQTPQLGMLGGCRSPVAACLPRTNVNASLRTPCHRWIDDRATRWLR